jgi:hypothetical protein
MSMCSWPVWARLLFDLAAIVICVDWARMRLSERRERKLVP